MFEFTHSEILKRRVKRMLTYRVPLGLALLANIVLIVRVPWASVSDAKRRPPGPLANGAASSLSQPSDAQETGVAPERACIDAGTSPTVAEEGGLVSGFGLQFLSRDSSVEHDNPFADAFFSVVERYDAAVQEAGDGTASALADSGSSHPAVSWFTAAKAVAQAVEPLLGQCQKAAGNLDHTRALQAQRAGAADGDENGAPTELVESASQKADSTVAGTPEQQESSDAPSVQAADVHPVTLCNRAENRAKIRFLLNDKLQVLQPGESRQFNASDQWQVKFHRGGDFGNSTRTISDGYYHFVVTERGWKLVPFEAGKR